MYLGYFVVPWWEELVPEGVMEVVDQNSIEPQSEPIALVGHLPVAAATYYSRTPYSEIGFGKPLPK